MFGHNKITGKRFFAESPEAAAGKLLVTSVFQTLQGEGPYAGQPAVFVRLALCNLACSWCDTFFDRGDWMSAAQLCDKMMAACDAGPVPDLVVVTGGEPTLQAAALGPFLEGLCGTQFGRAQIESNGIHPADSLPDWVTVVVSPKCAEVDGKPTRYLRPGDATLSRADCLKFVLSGDPDSPYHEVPDWALEWQPAGDRAPVYVSPMAEYNQLPEQTRAIYAARLSPDDLADRTAAEKISFWEPGLLDMAKCRRNYEYAALYAVRHGLWLSVQMHLFASLP